MLKLMVHQTQNGAPFWVNSKHLHVEPMLLLKCTVGMEVARSFHQVVSHLHRQYGWRNRYPVTNLITLLPLPQFQINSHSKHQHGPLFHICEIKNQKNKVNVSTLCIDKCVSTVMFPHADTYTTPVPEMSNSK